MGALPRSPEAGLGAGGDGWVCVGGGGALLECRDPLLQSWIDLWGDHIYVFVITVETLLHISLI